MKRWTADISQLPSWIVTSIGLFAAAGVGFSVPGNFVLFLLVVAGSGVLVFSTLGHRTEKLFLPVLGALLLGYILQGRGFAYLGIAPLYIGELVLAFGLMALPFARVKWRFSWLEILLIAFMLLGLLRTMPYLRTDGLNAVRDSAIWYYAAFAIIVSHLLTEERVKRVVWVYAKLLGMLLIWILVMSTVLRVVENALPHYPGSPLPLISVMEAGDRAVVLAGIAGFMMTGLYYHVDDMWRIPTLFSWGIWLICVLLVSIESRGGFLALALATSLVLVLRPPREWIGEGLKIGFIGFASLSLLLIINPTIDVGANRIISVDQLTTNIMSIYSDDTGDTGIVQGTKDWRLLFWTDIYNETVRGPLFWTGDGFGENLVSKYGYIIDAEEAVRAPHSIHFTILGRMGVPGALLWIVLQGGFLIQMLGMIRKARYRGNTYWASVLTWLLAMWAAALVTGSFDPYLEGPQGAIPFWCVFGAGIAAMRIQRQAADPGAQPAKAASVRGPDAYPMHS